MKFQGWLLTLVLLCIAAVITVDRMYVSKFEKEFRTLENARIVTSNKLATAKIVYENLNHVRDLVFKNMDFPGAQDSVLPETYFFEFMTTCINDLKMKLVKVEPVRPVVNGRVTTNAYDIEVEGDFFKFGELCSKFENSRRIVSIETFKVEELSPGEARGLSTINKGIRVTMRVNTYRVRKESAPIEPVQVKKG